MVVVHEAFRLVEEGLRLRMREPASERGVNDRPTFDVAHRKALFNIERRGAAHPVERQSARDGEDENKPRSF